MENHEYYDPAIDMQKNLFARNPDWATTEWIEQYSKSVRNLMDKETIKKYEDDPDAALEELEDKIKRMFH